MKAITKAFSHINVKNRMNGKKDWGKPTNLESILKSSPMRVNTFEQLVKCVAQVSYLNREFTLFFRGQQKEYSFNGEPSILPRIYRKKLNERMCLKKRYEKLQDIYLKIFDEIKKWKKPLSGKRILLKYKELLWAIIQHYQFCDTPLIDLTQSLHVACSFALDENNGNSGIIYVIALPRVTGNISYYTEEEILNIRLLSFCSPEASRPFFQEAIVSGPFPMNNLDDPCKIMQYNFARRVVAKFRIPRNKQFWGIGFGKIPHSKLFPQEDEFITKLQSEIVKINKK